MRKTFDDVRAEQRVADAEVIREFFARVPEDSVLGLLAVELMDSILAGHATRQVEG